MGTWKGTHDAGAKGRGADTGIGVGETGRPSSRVLRPGCGPSSHITAFPTTAVVEDKI